MDKLTRQEQATILSALDYWADELERCEETGETGVIDAEHFKDVRPPTYARASALYGKLRAAFGWDPR